MRTRILLNLLLTLILVAGVTFAASPSRTTATVLVVSKSLVAGAQDVTPERPRADSPQPSVSNSTRNDVSPLLSSIQPILTETDTGEREIPLLPLPRRGGHERAQPGAPRDLAHQSQSAMASMPAPIRNFEGVSNVNNVRPPDPQGDVGPDHYVQWVNLSFAIWNKDGNLLYGPANGNTLWAGFGGPCETTNDGDPITLYDPIGGRWFMSQFALPYFPVGPFYQCIAVSQTGDPTGAWYRYEFLIPVNKMNDYPKFGVWPDGYYMSVNQFNAGSLTWGGAGVAAFERDKILNGKLAQMVYFDVGATTLDYGGMLPADLDGSTPPPVGSPNYFAEWDDSTQMGDPTDTLRLWEFHVDWANPENSTFGLANHTPDALLSTTDVDPDMCGVFRDCIPQPGTSSRLDAISDRLMYRLQYRNFGSHETLVTNHTVDVDGTDHAGIHWLELRKRGGTWSIHQEGVHAPDADHRWMGSIAMDKVGNIALGYSVASNTTFPSIRYTGRLAGDPLGTTPQGEGVLIAGTGSQTGFSSRWGDYSMMAVDPVDDCTFWYTQEYYQTDGSDWQTRIGSFRFTSCPAGPQGTLTGIIYQQGGTPETKPIADASVEISTSPTQTIRTPVGTDGRYTLPLSTGTYTVTASAYGHQPNSISGVNIISGTITTLNIPLPSVTTHVISGSVTDANAGWPLYTRITIQADPSSPPTPSNDFWNDPATGYYSVTLAQDITHTFRVQAWVPDYLPTGRELAPLAGNQMENWALEPDPTTCAAPGYSFSHPTYLQGFETNNGGYSHSGANEEWEWGTPTTWPHGCASGSHCWGTDLNDNYTNYSDQSLYSPVIDLSGMPPGTPLAAHWWQAWAIDSAAYDTAFVEISVNGDLWTKIWRHMGGTTQVDWTEMHHDISAAAGGSVQFRWRLTSNSSINYEGLYVDDVTITAGCVPSAGGLVIGNIYDANTHEPLIGAKITNDNGDGTAALATADDPAADEAFYTLFSPSGAHTFTATMSGGYGPDIGLVRIVLSDTVRQDFHLPAGWLTLTPDSLVVTLSLGMTTTVPLTLNNLGEMPLAFELAEEPLMDLSMVSMDAADILLVDEDTLASNSFETALTNLGYTYWKVDPFAFTAMSVADLLAYKTIIYAGVPWFEYQNQVIGYLEAGGRFLVADNDLGYSNGYSPFYQTYLQSNYVSDYGSSGVLTGLDMMAGVNPDISDDPWPDDFTAGPEGVGIFQAPSGNVAGIRVERMDYRAIYLAWDYHFIGTASVGDPEETEVLGIALSWLVEPTDVPWLSETPTSGVLAAMAHRNIFVTFDATVAEVMRPGAYHAQLMIDSDTPYPASILPVTLIIPKLWQRYLPVLFKGF